MYIYIYVYIHIYIYIFIHISIEVYVYRLYTHHITKSWMHCTPTGHFPTCPKAVSEVLAAKVTAACHAVVFIEHNFIERVDSLNHMLVLLYTWMECDVMWCYVMLCDVMWGYVMLCEVMWCYVRLCDVMWGYVMLCDVTWCYVMLCDVMLYSICTLTACFVALRNTYSHKVLFLLSHLKIQDFHQSLRRRLLFYSWRLGSWAQRMEGWRLQATMKRRCERRRFFHAKKNEVLFIPHSQSFGVVDHLNLTDQPLLAFGFKEEWTQKSIEFPKSPNLVTYPSPSITTSNTGSSDPSPLHPSTMPGSFSSR